MDKVKEAFEKVRADVGALYKEIFLLKQNLNKTHEEMSKILQILSDVNTKISEKTTTNIVQHTPTQTSAIQHKIQTHKKRDIEKPPFKPPKDQDNPLSIGNVGVPTDKQTNRQTDTQHINQGETTPFLFPLQEKTKENVIDNAAMILESLDNIKKEIRLKFKRLTDQEILVFSALYQLDEEQGHTEYRTLAQRLGLSESSIRDYVGRLIKKGIPVEKKKINNKTIHLSVSANLKKIATLQTILQLRDI